MRDNLSIEHSDPPEKTSTNRRQIIVDSDDVFGIEKNWIWWIHRGTNNRGGVVTNPVFGGFGMASSNRLVLSGQRVCNLLFREPGRRVLCNRAGRNSRFARCLIAIFAIFHSIGGVAGLAQEQTKEAAQQFDNPFERPSRELEGLENLKPSERDGRTRAAEPGELERIQPAGQGRIAALFGNEVKKLIQDHPTDEKLRSLKKARCRAAFVEVEARLSAYRAGLSSVEMLAEASTRLVSSLLALDPEASTRMKILKHNVEIALEAETYATKNWQQGTGTLQDVARAEYGRLGAEILLEEAKANSEENDESEAENSSRHSVK